MEHHLASRQEILQIFKKGAEFTEDLLKENERLRFRVAELENDQKQSGSDRALVQELLQKISRLESEKEALVTRFGEVEQENRDFADRYVTIEQENNNLLNIYVASYQLHSTLDFDEVLGAIAEVVLNFIGAEVFLVAMLEEGWDGLRVLVDEGLTLESERLELRGVVGDVVSSGVPHFVTEIEDLEVDFDSPAICIPLKIKDQVIGVISIYKFLRQKKRLASVDHELFTLLAGHAATALFASKLYTDSKRKLNTIQGFIDLVTS
ncbi:MAG: GAF domain-containing protein [Myxococcota bacterium]